MSSVDSALWSNPIIAADAKEFAIIMKILIFFQIKCLNLDEHFPPFSKEETRKQKKYQNTAITFYVVNFSAKFDNIWKKYF